MTVIRLNYRPSNPDSRDLVYQTKNLQLPASVDLREFDSRVESQDDISSCVSIALTTAYEVMVRVRYPEKFVELSRLFVYYHSRLFLDEIEQDRGSFLRDGLKSIKHYGVCSEELWPYVADNLAKQPPPPCYLDAAKRTITSYNILFTNNEIREVLSTKQPVVLGMEIFNQIYKIDSKNPIISLPGNVAYSLGYHAVTIMGYSDETNSFLIKNSWGPDWGDKGYAWLPYNYVSTYGSERWCFDIDNQSMVS